MRPTPILGGAVLAVPGRLETPTGGYEYARQLLARARARHMPLTHWPLPMPQIDADGGQADPGVLEDIAERLSAAPDGWPVLIDGLAYGLMPAALIAALPCPVAALVHHPLAEETGLGPAASAALARSERAALAEARAVVVTSAHTAETLIADYAVARSAITIAQPGTPRPGNGRGGRAILPGPDRGVRLLSVGSLVARKGHDVLLRALAPLAGQPWHLSIIGSDTRDPATAMALRALIGDLGLAAQVTLAGDAARGDIDRALGEADVFVLASRHEGYGMAYAEAVAAGLPVIGTEAGAIAEATRGAALLVPPDDAAALTAALAPLIASPRARAERAAASRHAATLLPGWDDTLDTVLAALLPLQGHHHTLH